MHTQDDFVPQLVIDEPRQPNPRRYTTQRGTGPEALEVKRRLGGFVARQAPVYHVICDRFPSATKNELISVADMIVFVVRQRFPGRLLPPSFANIDRVTRRSVDLLIKWFQDHWMIISDVFWDVGLADSHFNRISKNSL